MALCLTFSSAYKVAQYESGTDQSIHWAPVAYHVLQSANTVPRSVDVPITFKTAFTSIPQVAIALAFVDADVSNYIITVRDVTANGIND